MGITYVLNPFTGTQDAVNTSSGGVPSYPNSGSFPSPATAGNGALAVDKSTGLIYESNGSTWQVVAGYGTPQSVGTIDTEATPSSNAATFQNNQLIMQSASSSVPGVVNNSAQTFTGVKTFSNEIYTNGGLDVSTPGTLGIGTLNASTINIGNTGATVNIQGTVITEQSSTLNVTNPVFTVNTGGSTGSASNSGMQVSENSTITGYVETSADRNSWTLKAPNTAGVATITPGVSGITLNQSSHNPVTLGTANGLSLSTQQLSLGTASTSTTGALTSTDWNTFNNKQSALTFGNLTDSGTDGITVTNGTGSVIGSGTSIAQQAATSSTNGYLKSADWTTFNSKGIVNSVSVASSNGLAGTSSGGSTPSLTLSTTVTGVVKGNGTSFSAATSGTDYSAGTSSLGTGILKSTTGTGALTIAVAGDFPTLNQNTTGTASNVTGIVAIANGGTNSSTALNNNRVMVSSGGSIVETSAITANQALVSNSNGIPIASVTTATELSYVSGTTSSIQTQLNNKANANTGDISVTSFSGNNNQSTAANVTGFAFSNSSVRSFSAIASATVIASTSLYETFTINAVQKGSSWEMSVESTGDSSLVIFTITSTGQVQYTSGNYSGFTSLTIKFRAITLPV